MGEFLESYYNAFILDNRYLAYLDGLKITLLISFFAIILGSLIGIIVAIAKVTAQKSKGKNWFTIVCIKLVNTICNGYINIIRGTPVMVQLLIIYNLIFTSRNTNEIVVGAICFGINSGAYVAEIVRAGIESIDKGQNEAGRSLGLNNIQTMLYIILPQAIKNILPALGNEFIVLVKETSVAGVIAVTDLTKAAQYIGSRTYQPLPPLIITAVFYLIIVLGLTKFLGIFERRMRQGDKH
ncbi:amino acid ABC transporter membrane protein (PAAT family) [Mobilisporobacter senegalensis]|uniref:Amino acid ABC transporter membrane protein (PAAT family) n=1 Tax=Mobilisporobacter senegalensis TaxID=1329262 RepID=A0A3N1XZ45_9FIRM|nr:amino acid ABC transporter permease [Mobilisporobacter senegalensis]ROR31860.1 amino acid ABC transporter membrane protein (PAAT family) [Mobilisporobacter senegalensis]